MAENEEYFGTFQPPPKDLAAEMAAAKIKRSNQRQRNKLEKRRQSLLLNLKSATVADGADLSLVPDEVEKMNRANDKSGNNVGALGRKISIGLPSRVGRLGENEVGVGGDTENGGGRLQRVASKVIKNAATKAVDQTNKVMNPAKPSLADVARMYLQDVGEDVTGRALNAKETEFVREGHGVGTSVTKVQEMFRDVDGTIKRRLQMIENRRQKAKESMNVMEAEHVTYSEYQKYMRKRGFLQDDREDVPEGNLIPILAVLQGQAESIGFMKAQRKLVRIGDFVVEIDPNDPLFARYDNDVDAKAEEEKRRNFQLYKGGKFKDADVQTEDRDDDATDAEIAFVYRRLDECQNVIEVMDKSKLDAELFVETALSRIVNLRASASKMYDTLETGQSTLMRLTAEAMAQNERLWKKLEAAAQEGAEGRAKKSLQRTFTQQIERLTNLNQSLKLRIEDMESASMQLCQDYHHQDAVHDQKMDDLRKQVIHRAVKDELNKLTKRIEKSSAEDAGGPAMRKTKSKFEDKVENLTHLAANPPSKAKKQDLHASPTGSPPVTSLAYQLIFPPGMLPSLNSSMESAFASLDEIARQTQRQVFDMMMNPHQTAVVVQRVQEISELTDELRNATQGVCNEFMDLTIDTVTKLQEERERTVRKLEARLATQHAEHVAEMAKQEEELTKKFQQRLGAAMPVETFEREKAKAVNKEKDRVLSLLGKEIPFPQVSIPALSSTFPVPKIFHTTHPSQLKLIHPQDLLHAAGSYFSEMVMEMCMLCTQTNQKTPPRLAEAGVALRWIKLAQEKATTFEGLIDGVALKMPEADGAARALRPIKEGEGSSSRGPPMTEAQSIALVQRWWEEAGGDEVAPASPSRESPNHNSSNSPTPGSSNAALSSQFAAALKKAAAILTPTEHFSNANLAIRNQISELRRAADHVISATMEAGKKHADSLRAAGILPPKVSPEALAASVKLMGGAGASGAGDDDSAGLAASARSGCGKVSSPRKGNKGKDASNSPTRTGNASDNAVGGASSRSGGNQSSNSGNRKVSLISPGGDDDDDDAANDAGGYAGGGGILRAGSSFSVSTNIPMQRFRSGVAITTADRATSPMQKFKRYDKQANLLGLPTLVDADDNNSRNNGGFGNNRALRQETKELIEQRAAVKAREEMSTTLRTQYLEMHAAIDYLRISFMHAFNESDKGKNEGDDDEEDHRQPSLYSAPSMANITAIAGDVSRLFALQIRSDREILDKITSMVLFSADEGPLDRARSRYRAKAPQLGVKSRVHMFLGSGVDKGVMCDLIVGNEAVMASAEALQYAVQHDMRVLSTKRRLLQHPERDRLKFEVDDSVCPPVRAHSSMDAMGTAAKTLPPITMSPTPSTKSKDAGAATPKPWLGGGEDDEEGLISVRRLDRATQKRTLRGTAVSTITTPPPQRKPVSTSWGGYASDKGLVSYASPAEAAYSRGKKLENEWAMM
ncbi:Hypothetical protein, putative [Bodo saltans]|uniref:Uncharacterized protein n=1 Tax=Bodo saltans TaxID=75058 RepID=A0A0S4JMN8_BODSA|nr:Hypothetical protein, putative [Bodo saltans]|eukprot:CUG91668.1 Hypothetical protein, putative [Bodo saltans]